MHVEHASVTLGWGHYVIGWYEHWIFSSVSMTVAFQMIMFDISCLYIYIYIYIMIKHLPSCGHALSVFTGLLVLFYVTYWRFPYILPVDITCIFMFVIHYTYDTSKLLTLISIYIHWSVQSHNFMFGSKMFYAFLALLLRCWFSMFKLCICLLWRQMSHGQNICVNHSP